MLDLLVRMEEWMRLGAGSCVIGAFLWWITLNMIEKWYPLRWTTWTAPWLSEPFLPTRLIRQRQRRISNSWQSLLFTLPSRFMDKQKDQMALGWRWNWAPLFTWEEACFQLRKLKLRNVKCWRIWTGEWTLPRRYAFFRTIWSSFLLGPGMGTYDLTTGWRMSFLKWLATWRNSRCAIPSLPFLFRHQLSLTHPSSVRSMFFKRTWCFRTKPVRTSSRTLRKPLGLSPKIQRFSRPLEC